MSIVIHDDCELRCYRVCFYWERVHGFQLKKMVLPPHSPGLSPPLWKGIRNTLEIFSVTNTEKEMLLFISFYHGRVPNHHENSARMNV